MKLFFGDCINFLNKIPSESVHSLVTDPPCGRFYKNLKWDQDFGGKSEWIEWFSRRMENAYRVLKPGALALVWSYPTRVHWTMGGLERAGLEIKDTVLHLYDGGLPKSNDLGSMIEKCRYFNMDDVYKVTSWISKRKKELNISHQMIDKITGTRGLSSHWMVGSPSSQAQIPIERRWEQLKTLLGEPPNDIKKIIESSFSNFHNERKSLSDKWRGWGTSLKPSHDIWILAQKPIDRHSLTINVATNGVGALNFNSEPNKSQRENTVFENRLSQVVFRRRPSGSKAKKENLHPTAKTVDLMKDFVQMITPQGGVVLDPFMGSGTTGVAAKELGFSFYGSEIESEYFETAKLRLKQYQGDICEQSA